MPFKNAFPLFVLSITLLFSCGDRTKSLLAQNDWGQWMGPGRDNVWLATDVLEKFPDGGPKILWRTPIAGGYSGPAVVGDRVYITDYQTTEDVKVDNFQREKFTGQERVLCVNADTGAMIWKHEYPVEYSISYPAGPRCTPVVDGALVYTLGAEGQLICLNAEDGRVVWQIDLKAKYQTKAPLWGYAGHPLIDGNHLLTLVGGTNSHIVAFDKRDGTEIWKALTSPEQGYSPPTIIEAGGVRQLILPRPDAVTSLNPDTGSEYWTVPYEATSGSIIMAPILCENFLFIAGYSRKSLLLELAADKPAVTEVWRDKGRDAISPVNVQPFCEDKIVYGMDQSGLMCALEIPSGNRLWSTPAPISEQALGSGTAFIVKQGERFWLFNELGELIICQMNKDGYTEIDRAKVIEPSNLAFGRKVVWSMPAFYGNRCVLRNDNEIICVDLAAPK